MQRTLATDARGSAFACLPPSGASPCALTADVDGYVARVEAAVALDGATAVERVQPGSIAISYGLLAGTPIRTRKDSTVVRQGTTSGLLLGVGVEFHEVAPGTYTAERRIQPLLGDGYWGGATTVAIQSGVFSAYTL